MSAVVVRNAEPSDYVAAREVHGGPLAVAGTLQLPLPSAALWKQRLENPPEGFRLLAAEVEGKVVGFLGLHPSGNLRRKHVASLGMAVHDDWHGRGVGSALMDAAIDLTENWLNISRLELTVFVDNEPAIGLYRKYGFEIEGTHRKYAVRDGRLVDTYAMARVRE